MQYDRANFREHEPMTKAPLRLGFKQMLAEANAVIETISVQDLPYLQDDPDALIIDVREAVERERDGAIPGSMHSSRGLLEFHVDPESPAYKEEVTSDKRIVLFCGTGGRSALAAKTMIDMGYQDVLSLAGGFAAWAEAEKSNPS